MVFEIDMKVLDLCVLSFYVVCKFFFLLRFVFVYQFL